MLLVNDDYAQPMELDGILNDRLRPDYQFRFARGDGLVGAAAFGRAQAPGEQDSFDAAAGE